MIPTNNENNKAKVYKCLDNSEYIYEEVPSIEFRCRMASPIEKKKYRLIKGVNASTDSTFLFASNLPYTQLRDGDRIEFLGKIWTVESIGYYLEQSKVINNGIMSEEYLIQKSPKGITIL